ncbi:MAG: dihydroneopterin aldolase family protein [Methanosarcinales archaeon]|nr:MAG: dihydroneopterin aldolase family protein [Methanosarcinales archaeon]
MASDKERALFEVGIKLGALYHQHVGMPINLDMLDELERAIEKSVSLQPYVRSVKVSIDREMVQKRLNEFGYCELEGRMLDAEVEVQYKSAKVVGQIKYDEVRDYPMMFVEC